MMKKIIGSLFALVFFSTVHAQTTMSPQQVLNKTVDMITASKGCEAVFKVFNSGYSGRGSISTSGKKFRVIMPDAMVWYNGKDLYTYNKNTEETTLVVPNPAELTANNPLAYVTSAGTLYNVDFSTVKKEGYYVLELTPKEKNEEIKRITLTLRKSDYKPVKIVVEPLKGNPISADITSFKTGLAFSPNDFEYPKWKYPKAEIIDLR